MNTEQPDTTESAAVETTSASSVEQNEDTLKANEMTITSDAAVAPGGKTKAPVHNNKRKSPTAMETKPSATNQNEKVIVKSAAAAAAAAAASASASASAADEERPVKVKTDEKVKGRHEPDTVMEPETAASSASGAMEAKSLVEQSTDVDETAPPVKKKRKSPAVPWKKPASMPKRPLSAYNLYFKDERKRLLLAKTTSNNDSTTVTTAADAATESASPVVALGVESERSSDELGVSSRSGSSLASAGTSGRKHVAVSGLGFASLAKTVAAKWKSLDAATKAPYEERAAQDKKRYDVQVADWREKQRKTKEEAKAAVAASKKKKSSPSTPPTHPKAKGTEGISPPDHHSLGSISDTYPHDWFETGTAAPAALNVVPGHVNALNDESSRTNTSSLYESSRTNSSSYASQHHHHHHQFDQRQHQHIGELSPMQQEQQQAVYQHHMSSLASSMQQVPVNPFAGDDLLPALAPPPNGFDSLYFTTQQAQSARGGNNNSTIHNTSAMEAFGSEPFNPHQNQQQHQHRHHHQQQQVPRLSTLSDMNIPQNRSMAFSLQPRRMMASGTSSSNSMPSSNSLQDDDLCFFGHAPSMAVTSVRVQADAAAAAQNNMLSQSSSTMLVQGGYHPQVEQKMNDQDSTLANSNRFSQSSFDPPSRAELGYLRPMNTAPPMEATPLMAAPASRLQLRNFQPPPTGIQQHSHVRLQQQHQQRQLQQQMQMQEQFQSQWGLGGGGGRGGSSSALLSSMQSNPQSSQNIDVANPNAHDDGSNIGLGHIRRVEEMRAEDVVKQQRLQHQQFLERQQRQYQQMQEQRRRQQMLEHQRRQQLLEEQRMLQQRQLQVQQQLQQHSLQAEAPNVTSTGSGGGGETLFSIRETLDDDMILFLTHLQNGNAGPQQQQQQQHQHKQGDFHPHDS